VPQDAEQIRPVNLPSALGGAILHAEPLRHGQANAATGGIWRFRPATCRPTGITGGASLITLDEQLTINPGGHTVTVTLNISL
jgi:hypothetical protein